VLENTSSRCLPASYRMEWELKSRECILFARGPRDRISSMVKPVLLMAKVLKLVLIRATKMLFLNKPAFAEPSGGIYLRHPSRYGTCLPKMPVLIAKTHSPSPTRESVVRMIGHGYICQNSPKSSGGVEGRMVRLGTCLVDETAGVIPNDVAVSDRRSQSVDCLTEAVFAMEETAAAFDAED
jgi:hypothetical protein